MDTGMYPPNPCMDPDGVSFKKSVKKNFKKKSRSEKKKSRRNRDLLFYFLFAWTIKHDYLIWFEKQNKQKSWRVQDPKTNL